MLLVAGGQLDQMEVFPNLHDSTILCSSEKLMFCTAPTCLIIPRFEVSARVRKGEWHVRERKKGRLRFLVGKEVRQWLIRMRSLQLDYFQPQKSETGGSPLQLEGSRKR